MAGLRSNSSNATTASENWSSFVPSTGTRFNLFGVAM